MKIDFEKFKAEFKNLPLGLRINNLGCVRYNEKNKWIGQIDNYQGFVVFKNVEYGLRAMTIILMNYIYKYRLFDVKSILERYAPAGDGNAPELYSRIVMQQTGYRTIPHNIDDLKAILPSIIFKMTCVENGKDYYIKSFMTEGFVTYFCECVIKYIDEYLNNVIFPVNGRKETI